MNGQDIITRFELYTDDTTELASSEELDLANLKLSLVYQEAMWEFLRKNATGTVGATGITLPADFDVMMMNYNEDVTNPMVDTIVVFIGSNSQPYKLIPMGSRNLFRASTNICWVNIRTGLIEFNTAPVGSSYSFDYKYRPDPITVSTSPVFPVDFHPIVFYAMLMDDEVIQKVERARSNYDQNFGFYNKYLSSLKRYNAKFVLIS